MHLQYLGHPIVNDLIYNDELYNQKKAEADALDESNVLSMPFSGMTEDTTKEESEDSKEIEKSPHYKEGCPWCAKRWKNSAAQAA